MKRLILTSLLLLVITACSDNSVEQEEQFRAQASLKIKTLAGNLKQALGTSMQAGGPGTAIDTCQLQAQDITQALNNGMSIKRTSLKLRNPKNAPDAWEENILQSFSAQLANGTPAKQLSHFETVNTEDGTLLRLMRAIPTQGVCLTCHGDTQTMNQAVVDKLHSAYPEDRATGYQVGQIRGAFSVTQLVNP